VCVNGLGLTLHVNVNSIMKFICTPCTCKNNYISIILCDPIKKCKCKNIYIYMILHDFIKQCKKCDFYLRGDFIMFLMISQLK